MLRVSIVVIVVDILCSFKRRRIVNSVFPAIESHRNTSEERHSFSSFFMKLKVDHSIHQSSVIIPNYTGDRTHLP